MNTLIFLGGMGAGALLAALIILSWVRIILWTSKKSQDWNTLTSHLMKERNEIAKAQFKAMYNHEWDSIL